MIDTLPPIPTTGLTKADVETLMAHTYDVMLKQFNASSKEVQIQYNLQQEQQKKQQTLTNGNVAAAAATAKTVPVGINGSGGAKLGSSADDYQAFNEATCVTK